MMDDQKLKPALLLLPNLLGDLPHHEMFIPASVDKAVSTLDGLIAESATAGRRYLSRFKTKKPANEIPIALFNEHTPDADLDFLLEPILKGERWGLISDAGIPCVADPGAKLVSRARTRGLAIQAFVGPSAIFLSLMLSGLPGQRFSFLGYLDREPAKREKKIRELQKVSTSERSTQIFIEAPYRNVHTLGSLLKVLHDQTLLCVAWDLTLPSQSILTHPVQVWKRMALPNLDKKNAIFLVAAECSMYR